MDEEGVNRLAAKKFAIGYNTGRKREREQQAKARKRAFKAGAKAERKRLAKERGRKKWTWKYRVFSVRTVFTVAFSVVTLKALEIVIAHLLQ